MARPLFLSLCAVVAGGLTAASHLMAAAPANPYDLLARITQPLVNVFSEKPLGSERALSFTGRLEEATGLPPELANLQVEVAVEYPDKVRLHGPLLGKTVTLCRRGETIWVYPGSVVKALLAQPDVAERLPKPDRKYKLKDFKLPLGAKELFFLPALFQAQDVPGATLDDKPARALDLQLIPEIAKSVKVQDWRARVWVDEANGPARLSLTRPEGNVVVRFDRFAYAETLPPETWVPSTEEQTDVLIVPPARYDQLVRALLEFRK